MSDELRFCFKECCHFVNDKFRFRKRLRVGCSEESTKSHRARTGRDTHFLP